MNLKIEEAKKHYNGQVYRKNGAFTGAFSDFLIKFDRYKQTLKDNAKSNTCTTHADSPQPANTI